jgi:hypothetical protein
MMMLFGTIPAPIQFISSEGGNKAKESFGMSFSSVNLSASDGEITNLSHFLLLNNKLIFLTQR